MSDQDVTPGKGPYLLALLIAVVGIGIFVALLVTGIRAIGSIGDKRMVVPGRKVFPLEEAGGYVIFHENPSTLDGKTYAVPVFGANFDCRLVEKGTGEEISLGPSTASITYNYGGRSGQAIMAFEVARPGDYELTAGYAGGAEGPQTVLAVGRGQVFKGVGAILGSCAVLAVSVITAGIIVVLTLIKRSSAKKRQAAPPAPPAVP